MLCASASRISGGALHVWMMAMKIASGAKYRKLDERGKAPRPGRQAIVGRGIAESLGPNSVRC